MPAGSLIFDEGLHGKGADSRWPCRRSSSSPSCSPARGTRPTASDPRQSLLLLMEAMCAINQLHLKLRRYPKLYESGVVYRREDGTENWLDIPSVIKAGWGDCEDLVFWRVAELRKDGVKAAPFAKWRRVNGVYKYHALVRRFAPGAGPLRPDGEVERLARGPVASARHERSQRRRQGHPFRLRPLATEGRMNPLAPKIDNPLAAAASHPLVAATKEQMAVTTKQPLVEYVRRSLELEDPEEIDRRADELTVIGYEKTADHLREHAGTLRARRRRRPGMTYRSPIPEASDQQWARFVRLMQAGDVAAVTPSGQLGIFQTRLKRLQDLGLARDVRRVNGDRRRAVDRCVPAAADARAAAGRPVDPVPDLRREHAAVPEPDPGRAPCRDRDGASRGSRRPCRGCWRSPTTRDRRSRLG